MLNKSRADNRKLKSDIDLAYDQNKAITDELA